MSQSSKPMSERDGQQALQYSFNDVDKSLQVSGFLTGKVGHKVELSITQTTVPDDTEVFTFKDGSTTLYQITIVYVDGTRELMLSAERTA